MKTFPMFLQMAGRRVVIAGGGEQAAQKARLFGKTDAQLVVLADDLVTELADKVASGAVVQGPARITPDVFKGAALIVVGTGCPGADAATHALAKEAGGVVNVVDQPWLCDALTPSIVDRDPVVVAIGTEGTAPVLGRQIKTRVEEMLEPDLGQLAAFVGRIRDRVAFRFQPRARRDFYRWIFAGAPRDAHRQGDIAGAEALIETAVDRGAWDEGGMASLCVVEASPDATDLIALRGIARLQEADVVFADTTVESYLELARRDADRETLNAGALDAAERLAETTTRKVWLVPTGQGRAAAQKLAAEFVPGP